MSHVELEESLPKLRSERDSLAKVASSAEVFQQGLAQMRTMLEQEIDKNQGLQDKWEQLQHLQKKSDNKRSCSCLRHLRAFAEIIEQ